MSRPNLFIVGAPKCGTTAWVKYLSSHPDFFFSGAKEPHHFNTDIPGFRWYPEREDYLQLFAAAQNVKWRGEASILYLYSQIAAQNIRMFDKDARILIFTRNQAEFIPSYHHQLLYNRDENNEDIEQVWRVSGERDEASLPPGCRDASLVNYKAVGRFSEQVERYTKLFPADQVCLVKMEDWMTNPREAYVRMLAFLDVEDDGRREFGRVNVAHSHRSKLVGELTQRPPKFAKQLSRALRKLPGLDKLRPAHLLRKMNVEEGRRPKISENLAREIEKYYIDDNQKLAELYSRIGLLR